MTDTARQDADVTAVPEGWRGILDPGERILWQGRPDPGFYLTVRQVVPAVFGVFFAGFALVWMVMAAAAGGVFWMFGLIHFTVGVGLTGYSLFWDSFKRRHTWYTLTDRRAFIATDLPLKGKRLDSYAVTPDTRLSLQAGDPGSVIFAREERRGNRGRRYSVDVGFMRIGEAETVYSLMRGNQRGRESEA